jgi:hypothetical protein
MRKGVRRDDDSGMGPQQRVAVVRRGNSASRRPGWGLQAAAAAGRPTGPDVGLCEAMGKAGREEVGWLRFGPEKVLKILKLNLFPGWIQIQT